MSSSASIVLAFAGHLVAAEAVDAMYGTLFYYHYFFFHFILFILLSSERGLEGSYEDEPTVLYRRPRQGVCPTKVFKNHNLL